MTTAYVMSGDKPLSIAILAMGGQGGGVLSDWIVALAEANGWVAQATSVPGVAQRTGATIYYVEMVAAREGAHPVLSLMPMPGDVDIVLAAEYMEAGRSILRGLVTPDRTTLIASTHRSFAVVEKEKPGDGTGNSVAVTDAGSVSAKRTIAFDMEEIAQRCGTVISASLLGALAGAEALPFSREAFEAVITAQGRGTKQSLAAFAEAFDQARKAPSLPADKLIAPGFVLPATAGHAVLDSLLAKVAAEFPKPAHEMLFAGIRSLVDYQDPAYAAHYLDRVAPFAAYDQSRDGADLTIAAAKHIANALGFDDVIHVADLKTRSSRFARVRAEVGMSEDQLVYTTEFMHPRMEEVAGTLPRSIGAFLEARPRLMQALDHFVNRGRRMQTGKIGAFLMLYAIAGMKRYRRGTLRYSREITHIEHWLQIASQCAETDYSFAVEVLNCRRLVKGYSDTHARGTSKFDRVLAAVPMLVGKPSGTVWLQNLRQAALADEDGTTLDGALKTAASAYQA